MGVQKILLFACRPLSVVLAVNGAAYWNSVRFDLRSASGLHNRCTDLRLADDGYIEIYRELQKMPRLTVRTAAQVTQPSRVSRAVREQQEMYEGFIKQIGSDVGELEPAAGEQVRALKVRIRPASTRLGTQIDLWDADGKIYFATSVPKRGRRPRKQA